MQRLLLSWDEWNVFLFSLLVNHWVEDFWCLVIVKKEKFTRHKNVREYHILIFREICITHCVLLESLLHEANSDELDDQFCSLFRPRHESIAFGSCRWKKRSLCRRKFRRTCCTWWCTRLPKFSSCTCNSVAIDIFQFDFHSLGLFLYVHNNFLFHSRTKEGRRMEEIFSLRKYFLSQISRSSFIIQYNLDFFQRSTNVIFHGGPRHVMKSSAGG